MNLEIQFNAISKIAVSALTAFLVQSTAMAQDTSCNAYIDATIPKADRPYRVNQSIVVDGTKMESEAVYINNVIYTRSPEMAKGKWVATPMPDLKSTIEMAKKSTTRCKVSGADVMGGVPMKVWTSYAVTPFDPKPVEWKTWVGAADGRVYRQSSAGFEQRIAYDKVAAPDAADIAQPRKKR
ncbi:MAG: hypothetical protein EAZ43_08670 [Betaproteobacteria bacterium]|nr:MAG: hypothetical protein EAZ43_08670 [Betaproteobacteria bacterium]